ncbi:hypothetical protein NM688_g2500 [Phlebia brevispora]|uniref:Uncharacterized protein n=1 Tax=Phlebia brevispora TaxID=194682 RepID=A0ACC1T8N5_9APHY|nr:hypothetical protein NM688_g2500 [Phlebia brevispora]
MPPSKATKSKGSRPQTLKQSELSFTSKRNTTTGAKDGSKGKSTASSRRSSTVPNTPQRASSAAQSTDSDDEQEARRTYFDESDSESEEDAGGRETRPVKRRKLAGSDVATQSASSKDREERGKGVFRSRVSMENADGGKTYKDEHKDGEELPRLAALEKKGRWRKHYGEVRAKMGHIEPIHSKGLTSVHHILRVFDLSYEYGPCIGVTRLERWERASALGLEPPAEVKEILTTKEGMEKDEFKQCVFYGEV